MSKRTIKWRHLRGKTIEETADAIRQAGRRASSDWPMTHAKVERVAKAIHRART